MARLAIEYVKALKRGKISAPDGKPMTAAELRVLEPLAAMHNEFVWCSYPGKYTIACMANMSQSHVDRQVLRLVKRGILRRYFVISERWQEQTSNEYEFVALGQHEVSQQTRDMIFKYKRVRSAVQLSLRRGGRQRKALAGHAGSTSGEQSDAGSNEQVQEQAADVELGGAEPADATLDDGVEDVDGPLFFVEESVDVIAGGNHGDCEGQSLRLPVELLESLKHDLSLTLPSPCAPECVKKLPVITKARTTASATANATTSSLQAAMVLMEQRGKAGMSPGGREVRPEVERGLENYDEVLREAVRWALAQSGIAAASATRTMRRAIGEALLLRMDQAGCGVAETVELMVDRRREYIQFEWAISQPVGLVRFVREGLWLDKNAWGWDKRAIRERRRPG